MNDSNWNIGVCSWSLSNDLDLLAEIKKLTDISTIHLQFRPELKYENAKFISSVHDQGWNISCGMIGFEQEDYSTLETIKKSGGILPEQNWPENKDKIFKAIDVASKFSIKYLSFHFGFLDVSNKTLINKIRLLADYAASNDVTLLMETGQETAEELVEFIETLDSAAIAINFDPANMILYGKGEPIDSLKKLQKWIRHIHLKDAVVPQTPGQWGTEVPWGLGNVGGDRFFEELIKINYTGALCVEREQGNKRVEDVISAIRKTQDFIRK